MTGLLAATAAFAQTAVFTLKDQTNLTPGTYQIYVTGFSTGGPYVLQPDGSWATPATTTTAVTLPCYRFPQDITQVQINGTQTAISGRVYYFIVTDTARFPSCNPSSGLGLFNQQGVANAFTYTYTVAAGMALTAPTVANVGAKNFPSWTFSEIGASSTNGTIDLSQVDFFSFPMNTTGSVSTGPSVIGNPVGATDNPNDVVNHVSVRDSYSAFINALAEAENGNKPCSVDPTPTECAYLDLLQDIKTAGSNVPEYIIQNPGGYLGQSTAASQASKLNGIFDGVIGQLWGASAPALSIDTGGALGGSPAVPEDVFTSSIVTMNFPGSSFPVKAMKFVGTATSQNYIAYIFSPKDYQTGCSGGMIPSQFCSNPPSTGYQVFASAGALSTPTPGCPTPPNFAMPTCTYEYLQAGGFLSTTATNYGSIGYNSVVARLGFLISGAMSRGVALANCSGMQTWQCWQNETYWYPTAMSSTFPDITQSLFAQWMHTASISGTPMFKQPPGAVQSASGSPGGGTFMSSAYGLANDENPTPPAVAGQPEVPSKFDSTVVYGGAGPYTITFGPWVTKSSPNPTLSVTLQGSGKVTSSPAGIDCGTDCSESYPSGTVVILTGAPAPGWKFSGWSGACSSGSLTCTVTVTTTTTATATFTQVTPPPPANFALHVVVSGPGSVASAPAGINCGTSCSTAFASGTSVTLTASPSPGANFLGWTGACSGTGTCVVTMTQDQTVGASFGTPAQFTLTVTGGVGGVVTTVPGGIDCGTTCTAGFNAGAVVNVVARPNPGFQFVGWSGACSGSNTCALTMNANYAVQATFAPIPVGQYALTVHDFGVGLVASSPGGISCGTSCSAVYTAGTHVTLTATPGAGYQFTGWSGACAGIGACVVVMTDVVTVDATFAPSAAPVTPFIAVPTLTQWGLIILSLLVLVVALGRLRQKA